MHANRNSIIEQIEVGHDTPVSPAPSAAFRQTPTSSWLGRCGRDHVHGSDAAETGHQTLSTLHTNDTSQAISCSWIPSRDSQPQIRQRLSLALLAIIAQQLIPSADETSRYPLSK